MKKNQVEYFRKMGFDLVEEMDEKINKNKEPKLVIMAYLSAILSLMRAHGNNKEELLTIVGSLYDGMGE